MRLMSGVVLVVFVAGCAPVSTTQVMPDAYYGDAPSAEDAQTQAKALLQGMLKDPYSAHWMCHPMKQGQLGDGKAFGSALTGWLLPCEVNAKNSYGAYAGAVPYVFLFRDGRLRRAVEISRNMAGQYGPQRVIFDN